eukprot:812813-Pelagomonas_calceolata.AAC.11
MAVALAADSARNRQARQCQRCTHLTEFALFHLAGNAASASGSRRAPQVFSLGSMCSLLDVRHPLLSRGAVRRLQMQNPGFEGDLQAAWTRWHAQWQPGKDVWWLLIRYLAFFQGDPKPNIHPSALLLAGMGACAQP